MRRFLPLILIGVIALVVGACGGDDDSPSGSNGGEALTQDEWVAAADAICAEGTAEIEAIETPDQPSSDEIAAEIGLKECSSSNAGT